MNCSNVPGSLSATRWLIRSVTLHLERQPRGLPLQPLHLLQKRGESSRVIGEDSVPMLQPHLCAQLSQQLKRLWTLQGLSHPRVSLSSNPRSLRRLVGMVDPGPRASMAKAGRCSQGSRLYSFWGTQLTVSWTVSGETLIALFCTSQPPRERGNLLCEAGKFPFGGGCFSQKMLLKGPRG